MMRLSVTSGSSYKGKEKPPKAGSKRGGSKSSLRSIRSVRSARSKRSSKGSLGSKGSKLSVTARSGRSVLSIGSVVSAVQEVDYLKGKYRFRALVRKVLINVAWLLETPAEEEEVSEGNRWARAMLRAKSRRRREGTQIFTWEEKVLFHRTPGIRSDEDTEKAYSVVKRMNTFKGYKEEIQRGLASCLYFMYLPQHRTVIKEGHEPFNLYFIIQGDVLINIAREDPYTHEMVSDNVAILSRGDMFGEVALLQRIPRTATVSTATVCEFLVLNRDDFMTVLQKTLAAQWKRFQEQLRRFSYFDSLNEVQLREACILGRMRTFERNDTIIGDGHGTNEYAHFLLSGTCTLVQTLTVEVWEEFGDTVYRLLDDPTLIAVHKLPENLSTKQRIPSMTGQDLAAQDEWSLAALRLENAIGSDPTSLQWQKARQEVERVLEKEEPFKHKTVVHADPWDQARLRVLETLGSHSARAHLLAGATVGFGGGSPTGSIAKGEGSNESLPRVMRRRSSLGGGSSTLMGAKALAAKASPSSPPPGNLPTGPEAVHSSILVERGAPLEARQSTGSSTSADGRPLASGSVPGLSSDRNQPFMDAARASVLGRSASFTRPSNVSRFSTVKVTDGKPSLVPMPGFGPYGPALLRLAQRAGAVGAGLRGMEVKKPDDAPRPKPHRIEMVRGHQERKESSKSGLLRLEHYLNHFPFKLPPDFSFSGKRQISQKNSIGPSDRRSIMATAKGSREMRSTSSRQARDTLSDLGKLPRSSTKHSISTALYGSGRQSYEKDSRGTAVDGVVKAFGSDKARKHTLKKKYAFEDPFQRTPKPRRISVASRYGIRSAWTNAVNVMRDCLDHCEQAVGDSKRVEIMVDFWRKARQPVERLMKKEHTPVMEPHHHLSCHFVQVCYYTPLAVFGLGECMDQRRVVATVPVECLLLPRYWLDTVNIGNVWDRVRLYLNRAVPDSKKVFRRWADERRWLRYRSHLVTEQIDKRYVESGTTPYDVPYSLRLGEITDPHARGYERRYVIRPQHAPVAPHRLSRRITRPLV